MSMIPTAEVLAAILNDPAIPAEAKPWEWTDRHVADGNNGSPPYIGVSVNVRPSSVIRNLHAIEVVNAVLFWSLSAWMWDRGIQVIVGRTDDGRASSSYPADGTPRCSCWTRIVLKTPTEALAAVVREVATASARSAPPASAGTPGSPPVA